MQTQLIVTMVSGTHNISLVATPLLSSQISTRKILEENFLEKKMEAQLIVTIRSGSHNFSLVTTILLSIYTSVL